MDTELSKAAAAMGSRRSPAKTAAARENGKKGGRPTLEEQARRRVAASPTLAAHAETIWADWPDWTAHVRWIATAPVSEIVDWAEAVEKAAA